jgi:hypothetical protein
MTPYVHNTGIYTHTASVGLARAAYNHIQPAYVTECMGVSFC